METNWIIIAVVAIIAVAVVIYLIGENQKDEKDVANYFNDESSTFPEDDEPESNDEK